MRSYSDRLGVIADDRFQAALDRHGLGRLLTATPITRGLFGQNVFLGTTVGEYVLRGSPHGPDQLPHERFFCQQLHERTTVPVPWPYVIDERTDLFGWPYALMPRMPGIHAGDQRKTTPLGERAEIARAMGDTLARMGEASWPHGARFDAASGGIVPSAGGLRGERSAWISEHLGNAESCCPATIADDRAWIDDIVSRGLDALDGVVGASATTQDFGEGNAVVERGADGWRVSGVFDFYEYGIGDLDQAVVRPSIGYGEDDPAVARAFVSGYAARRPFAPGHRARLALYALGDRLVIWNYGHSQGNWFPPELPFRAFAEPALRALDELAASTR